MPTDQKQRLPIWILKWKIAQGGRGRKHAAVFIPNSNHANDHPLTSSKCEGTEYDVEGSPFGGFVLNIRHDWDSVVARRLESAIQVASIDKDYVHILDKGEREGSGQKKTSRVDKIALTVRPPLPTARPWIAEEVMDCQDWVMWFVEQLVQQKMIPNEAVQAARSVMDGKTAIMPAPGQASTVSDKPSAPTQSLVALPITASAISALHTPSLQKTHASSSQPLAEKRGEKQWNDERSRFERYDSGVGRWEYYDGTQRRWIPFG